MIGKLKGLVDAIGESHCIIDVNGVGYEVQASARTLRNMEIGQPVTLSRTPADVATPTPAAGAHNDEILADLGYHEAGLARLRADGVI